MGLFSDIVSFASSALSAVGSAVSGALSTVGSALSVVAKSSLGIVGHIAGKAASLVGLASGLSVGPLGPVLGPIIGELVLKGVRKVITFLAKKIGIIQEKDKVEEVGYRVEEARHHEDWKRQEDFPAFKNYYEYLKNQIPEDHINYGRLKEREEEFAELGRAELTQGLEEEMGIELPNEFLFEVGKSKIEPNEFRAIVEAFKELGYDKVEAASYFKGNLPVDKSNGISDVLIQNLKKYYPDKTVSQLYAKLGEWRQNSRDDNFLKQVFEPELGKAAKTKTVPEPGLHEIGTVAAGNGTSKVNQ